MSVLNTHRVAVWCCSRLRCSARQQPKHDSIHLLCRQSMLLPPSPNPTSETLPRRNLPSYPRPSSCHLSPRLRQLCLIWSSFIDTATIILSSTHRRSPNKRSWSKRSHHAYTATTSLASHPHPYHLQNLPPHVSHSHWNLSLKHGIHGHAMFSFQY